MLTLLTREEVSRVRLLSESELSDFLREIPDDLLDAIVEQLDTQEPGQTFENYASERSARNAAVINAKTAAAQEIGPLPEIRDPARRERCIASNILFAETYFASTFYMGWAPYQRDMMDRFEEVVLQGGKKCRAVKRGGLKSTCARVSTLWAAVCGHRRFPVLVGATDDKSNEHRENFFALLASSDKLLEDFPELMPLLLKWKQPKRQFRLDGRLLAVHPKDPRGRIVFPDIFDAPSCHTHIAPYSVNATDVSGLSYVDRFGETVRPDLLVFDDVQTPQSASSPLMTEEREERIDKTFCGLFGLGAKPAALMVCTVRKHDDLTERYLNRKKHPDWDGRLYPSVIRMPDRMDLWEANAALLGQGVTPEDGKRLANDHYLKNRQAMDEGAKVAWEDDHQPDEPSALFSLMCVRAIDPEFFRCEIQQEGAVPVNTSGLTLNAQNLLTRLSHVPRGVIPEQAQYTTAFIDSSDQVLWWMVCAWQKDFSGFVVDYGTWPDQGRATFFKSDLVNKISDAMPGRSWEEAFVYAHTQLEEQLFREFPGIDLMLKDWSDGQQKPRVESQIAISPNKSRIRPSKGFANKPGRKPVYAWGDNLKSRHNGSFWVERREENPVHVQFDANLSKSHMARRLLTTPGAPSAIILPGSDERAHRMLAEHLTAETPKQIMYDGSHGVAWELIVGRDNDWLDCLNGNCVAASMLGCSLTGEATSGTRNRRTFSLPGARNG